MGTRAITRVYKCDADYNDDGKLMNYENTGEVVQLYRQFDGYPDGHGRDLAGFLDRCQVTNGIGTDEVPEDVYLCNGVGGFGAQLVRHFKNEWPEGNIYLQPFGTRESWYHVYEIGVDTQEETIVYIKHDDEFFESVEAFREYIEEVSL